MDPILQIFAAVLAGLAGLLLGANLLVIIMSALGQRKQAERVLAPFQALFELLLLGDRPSGNGRHRRL